MIQEIMALCMALGANPDQEELLLPLARAAEVQLAGRLREGVTAEDCGTAFPLAAAMTAMDWLSGTRGEISSFTAGELTIRRAAGTGTSAQAEKLLAPWLGDMGFYFQGVEG